MLAASVEGFRHAPRFARDAHERLPGFGRIVPLAPPKKMRPEPEAFTMRVASIALLACAIALASCAGPAGRVSVLQGDRAVVSGAPVAWAPLVQNELQNGDPRIEQ